MGHIISNSPNNPQVLYDASWQKFAASAFLADQIQAGWGKSLSKVDGVAYTMDDLQMILQPALDMVMAMAACQTPVQRVRLWSESILQAKAVIESLLPKGKLLGGPDLPSLALFLVTYAECVDIVKEVELAKLFAVSWDYRDYTPHPAGMYEDLGNQYLFRAAQRLVDPMQTFLWVEDAIDIICNEDSVHGSCFDPDPATNRLTDTDLSKYVQKLNRSEGEASPPRWFGESE